MSGRRRRVLLVGWDAADWKVARPLMARGLMPNLARLVEGGASGNVGTLDPPYSPMLWTSIATGKRPEKHGILGFHEPTDDGQGLRPVSTLSRTTKAVWNILNQNAIRPAVVTWWPSHPAEPLDGVMVSNLVHEAGDGPKPRPLPPGSVHPADWRQRIEELRICSMDVPGEMIQFFVPEYHTVDQKKDRRIHSLARVIAETINTHAVATEVLEHADWDFAAVYYDAIDHFSHLTMKYHPPRLPWVDEESFRIYRHVITAAYVHHDLMLGRLLELAGTDATTILVSDHGFHPDGLRPSYIPAESAGPSIEHRSLGMICLHGPGIKPGGAIHGASLLDVAPTVLNLFGLPVGRDMDGKVLATAFDPPRPVEAIDSWDEVEGPDGSHPEGARVDPVGAAEAIRQLVALGYVAPPGEDAAKAVADCLAELKYNKARCHDDAGRPDLSRPLYEALLRSDSGDVRYASRLISALIEVGEPSNAAEVLDAFEAHCNDAAPKAALELERRREARADADLDQVLDADKREQLERRTLAERASGYVGVRATLRLQVDLACERFDEARADLEALETASAGVERAPALFLARAYARLGDDPKALAWIDRALDRDPEDWQALTLSARLHLRNRRFASALDAVARSLALIYFQPVAHHVMGRALAVQGDLQGAERAFLVAVSQRPGLVASHEALARLHGRLNRPTDAVVHRNRAAELRRLARERREDPPARRWHSTATAPLPARPGPVPADPAREVVVVAGLPRSGTSMLMQLLRAGGVEPLTDGLREADSDNPRGYFEYERATKLARDAAWLPEARGKAVKLALPLVRHLPPGESYRLIVIERDVRDVIASQRAMLERLGRTADGAAIADDALAAEYARQRERLRAWLVRRPEVAVLPIRYEAILSDPRGTAEAVAAFLGRAFDVRVAARAVEPALRRQAVALVGVGS